MSDQLSQLKLVSSENVSAPPKKVAIPQQAQTSQMIASTHPPATENFKETKCATSEEVKRLDSQLSDGGKKKYRAERKYQGSKDGFTPRAFHSKADNLRATVSLCKLQNGTCIAGYTSLPWKSEYGRHKDKSAIVMNLTRNVSFAARYDYYGGIYCDKNRGAKFGGGDLVVYP